MKSACAQQVQSLSSGKELLPEPCAACAARVLSVCDAIDDCDLDRLAAITSVQDIARHQIFVTEGDPAWAGVLAGVSLKLPVYHIMEPEIKSQVDSQVYEDQVGLTELVLETDEIIESLQRVRGFQG